MTIKQISVFLENKSGSLEGILNVLKEEGIQLIASTVSDTVEYGIYRIICSNPEKASKALKEKGFSVNTTDVFAISLDNTPGTASNVITLFTKAKINISYLYSFLIENKGILIFRTDNPDKTKEIIILNKLNLFKL